MPDGTAPGRVFVIYGNDTLPGTTVDLNSAAGSKGETRILGAVPSSLTGYAVASGDIDGDGFDDVVIGAFQADVAGGAKAGAAYVVYGSAGLGGTTVNLADPPGTHDETRIYGDDPGDGAGIAVAAGDVNGDGLDDVLIGAASAIPPDGTGMDVGEVYAIYGSASLRDQQIDLNSAPGTHGETRIYGDDGGEAPEAGDKTGGALASGDVDADGLDDLVIGAFGGNAPQGRRDAGRVYIVYGDDTLPGQVVDLNTNGLVSDFNETRIMGQFSEDQLGSSVAAGDVDGDGFEDVVAGARNVDPSAGTGAGAVYVVHGGAVLRGTSVNLAITAADVSLLGSRSVDLLGTAVAAGADMDRDGFVEFAGDAPYGDNPIIGAGDNNTGYAAAVFGAGESLTATVVEQFAAGNTGWHGVGGRLSPVARFYARFFGGTAAPVTVVLDRDSSVLTNLEGFGDVASSFWHATTTRTGFLGDIRVQYVDAEVAGLNEQALSLYWAESPSGPWTEIASQALDTDRNTVEATVPALGYFVLVANQGTFGVAIGAPSVAITRTGPVSFPVVYTGAATVTLAAEDVSLVATGTATATVGVSGSGTVDRTVTLSDVSGDGTLAIVLDPGTATSGGGTPAPGAGPSQAVTVDNTPPAVFISTPSVPATNTGPVSYTVTYAGADTVTLATGNVTLNKTGTANGVVGVSGSGNSARTVTISSISGQGTLSISIAAGTATDDLGQVALGAGPSTAFAVDNAPPTVSLGAPSVATTRSGPVAYTVTYTGASNVTLTEADVTLNRTGTANGTVVVSGTGNASRTVSISGIAGDGTLGISVAAGTATDDIGNLALGAGPSATFSVDNTAPTVTIGAPSPPASVAGPVQFAVTYEGASSVTLSAANIQLIATGTATASVAVSGSGATARTVTLSGVSGSGTLAIAIAAGTAVDAAGNVALAAGPSVSAGIAGAGVGVGIGAPSTLVTSHGPVAFEVVYVGAANITLGPEDVTLIRSGTANGSVAVSGTGNTSRTVTINNITGDGTLRISLAAGTANNGVGGLAPAAGPSVAVSVDNTAPGVTIGAPSPPVTAAGPVQFTVVYEGASSVTLVPADVQLIATGSATANVSVSGSGSAERTIALTNVSGTGTLAVSIDAGTATDAVGNEAPAAGPSTPANIVNEGVGIGIGPPDPAITSSGPVSFQVVYVGATAITLGPEDVTLNKTGTANGTVSVSGTGNASRVVTISSISGQGTLSISIAAGTASNGLGQDAPAAGPSETVTVQPAVLGDVNGDGEVDAIDVQLVVNAVLGIPIEGNADVNGDGEIDAIDVQFVVNVVLGVF